MDNSKEFLEEFKKEIGKEVKVPKEALTNSMTTMSPFKSFPFRKLWRPNNYRRQIEVKTKNNSAIKNILTTIPNSKLNSHTKIISIKNYQGITIQYMKNNLIGIYKQNMIFGHKETYLFECENLKDLTSKIDNKKKEITNKIDKAIHSFCKQFNIKLKGKRIKWSRYEDWIKGDDYIDKIPRETIIHDTYFKKVYGEGIEFKTTGKKEDEEPIAHMKNFISNRAIENIAPEIAIELNKMHGTIKNLQQTSNKPLIDLQDIDSKFDPILKKLFKNPHKFNILSTMEKNKLLGLPN